MVALYVGGRKVEWADAERVLADPIGTGPVELRDGAGAVVARIKIERVADDPDWVKAITPEEIERRTAEPGFTFEEVKKRLGWE
jgi:hypothetical protein